MRYLKTKIVIDELTPSELYSFHKELWMWLAMHPECDKGAWPGWSNFTLSQKFKVKSGYLNAMEYISAESYCFACMYESQYEPDGPDFCPNRCLIRWVCKCVPSRCSNVSGGCSSVYSPFERWRSGPRDTQSGRQQRTRAALEVAYLPLSKNAKTIIDKS